MLEWIALNNTVFVHYISLQQIVESGYSIHDWPSYLLRQNLPCQIQCSCEKICDALSSNISYSDFMFVEFDVELSSIMPYQESFDFRGKMYHLVGMVRHVGMHFTCAVKEFMYENRSVWKYLDDLNNQCLTLDSFELVTQNLVGGWFFGVYSHIRTPLNQCRGFNIHTERFSRVDFQVGNNKDSTSDSSAESKTETIKSSLPKARNNGLKRKQLGSSRTANGNNKKKKKGSLNSDFNCKSDSINYNMERSGLDETKEIFTELRFDQKLPGKKNTVFDEITNFHNSMKMTIEQCVVCCEAWPIKLNSQSKRRSDDKSSGYQCTRCLRDKIFPKIFSRENRMMPSPVPQELQGLTQCEEMLIARAFPVMQVYMKPRFGTISYRGHVVTLPHNVQKIADVLPHMPSDLPIVIFKASDRSDKNLDFKVRRHNVLQALIWLKSNNILYKDVQIDMQRIQKLPEDDYLNIANMVIDESTSAINQYDCGTEDNQEHSENIETSSFLPSPSDEQPTE